MIRFLALFVGLLLPQALLAQYKSFEAGTYVLADNRQLLHSAKLKLRNENTLLVKDGKSEKQPLNPEDILWFQVGKHRFVPVGGFQVDDGFSGSDVQRGFAEFLDSGQVKLYEYRFFAANASPVLGSNKGFVGGGGASWKTVYLLQPAGQSDFTVVSANNWGGVSREFRETIAPLVTGRPDLQKLLADDTIFMENLVPFVRSLNRGLPTAAPAPLPTAGSN
ncbi:hypothetical protein [Hymenobacter actinosclerus]|uniref:Uncharacterized protein n=1 Tax=Hymenobacter actinosclerus TaxID=82805 RepID=A0A1I0FCS3_9BACT|nr:hypothetical protein [Hymenobacter actinosclerus]SET56063.1 hypothetical protein SAMN04487998_2219 [Hymenobacter actinosclerus]